MSAVTSKHVQDILEAVRDGLGPFVLRQYKVRYSRKEYLARLQVNLSRDALEDEAQALEELDFSAWRKAIEAEWDEIFSNRLGHRTSRINTSPDAINARNFLYELQNARNRWAHPKRRSGFSIDDAYRIADTATRLLQTLRAKPEAQKTADIRLKLGREIYGSEDETGADTDPLDKSQSLAVGDRQNRKETPKENVGVTPISLNSDGNLSGKNLREWNLKAANLQAVNMWRVDLAGVDLTSANLSDAALAGATMREVYLYGANLSVANLVGADLRLARISSSLNEMLEPDDREEPRDFEPWLLERVQVQDKKSAEAKGITIPFGVEHIVLTDFSHANLQGADMRNVGFGEDAELMIYFDILVISLVSFRHANLAYADLSDAWLELADFGEADLSDARFNGAKLFWTNFRGAKMNRANLSNVPGHFWEEMKDVDFSRADLTQAVLVNASLCTCIFNDAILYGANCAHSNFSDSTFRGADLSYSVFQSAGLVNTSFEKANLMRADLSDANLAKASALEADISEAKLIRANLTEVQLTRANLTRADLTTSDLTSADLTSAVLRNAELKKANLTEADLTGADLTDANLMDANFESAILKDAKLDKAKFRFTTKLPDGSYWSDDTDLTRFTS